MDNNIDIRDLQVASNYITLKAQMKSVAIVRIIIGLLLIIAGNATHSLSANPVMFGAGVLFSIQGILMLVRPSPIIVPMDFIWIAIFLGFGAVSGVKDARSAIMTAGMASTMAMVAVRGYRDFRAKVPYQPTPESMSEVRKMIGEISTRDAASDDLIVMREKVFKTRSQESMSRLKSSIETMMGIPGRQEGIEWRVSMGDDVVFVQGSGTRMYMKNRDDMEMSVLADDGDMLTVTVPGEAAYKTLMWISLEHYKRYLVWKGISVS